MAGQRVIPEGRGLVCVWEGDEIKTITVGKISRNLEKKFLKQKLKLSVKPKDESEELQQKVSSGEGSQ